MSNTIVNIDEKCINCEYYRNLNLLKRDIVNVGPNRSIIAKLRIEKDKSHNEKSLCCVGFYNNDGNLPIYETFPDDLCENFKPKIMKDIDKF